MLFFEEMKASEKNQIWKIVSLPENKSLVECNWMLTIKYKLDCSNEKYKAKLVAKGYAQTYEIDY